LNDVAKRLASVSVRCKNSFASNLNYVYIFSNCHTLKLFFAIRNRLQHRELDQYIVGVQQFRR